MKRVIYMGGAIDMPGNTTPAAEFNFWFDPEAIRITLRTPFKEQIVVPDDICERVFYTKAIYDRIVAGPETTVVKMFKERQGPVFAVRSGETVVHLGRADRRHHPQTGDGHQDGGAIHRYRCQLRTELRPIHRLPRITAAFTLESPENFPAGTQKVKIVFDIDREAFWDSSSV